MSIEKDKYLPSEIDRMIYEEISRIDAANTAANAGEIQCSYSHKRSLMTRIYQSLRILLRRFRQKE